MNFKKIIQEKLPLYEIMIDDEDETGIQLISLVDNPAIGVKGMAFSNEINHYSFKSNEDQQIIVGPALIPDLKIKRVDKEGNEYYVTFSKATISKLVEKFNRFGSNRRLNIDHSNQMVDGFIVEDWIIEDPVYDKAKKYGFELPVGSYMIKVKIENKEFWDKEVKDAGKFGFSIEGLLNQMLISLNENIIVDTNEIIYASEQEAFEDLDLIDLCNILDVTDYPECACYNGQKMEFQAKEGLVHPNCRCDLMMGAFQLSPTYIGKDGKEYPCTICETAFRRWRSSGRFQDVFGTRYTKINIFPYYVKRT